MESSTPGRNKPRESKGSPAAAAPDERPDCMRLLELLPPYSMDDVHRAYKARALKLHPDQGGSATDFVRLKEAYEEAQDFVKFREGRRGWMASQVEPYMRMLEIVGETERRGGSIESESVDWMQRSYGDFAALADRIRIIRYRGRDDGDSYLQFLAQNNRSLQFLQELDLEDTRLSADGFSRLDKLRGLQRLNLKGTAVTTESLVVLLDLPEMQRIIIGANDLTWWQRQKLGWKNRAVELQIV
ncbi:MAG: hypothetical protein EHM42_07850 [Planctomycetaceae bacterium]|nr:MAG: hypothetical protein EHM42_07850 [Planctomycetaceae bacterium]